MLTLQALTYIERHGRTIWNYATGTLTPPKGPDTGYSIPVINRITLSFSAVGKCAPMQVVKQPEQWKASTTEEQNVPPFRRTLIGN